jgi:TrmH family RNA methyltransferase
MTYFPDAAKVISSRNNPQIKRIRKLQLRDERERTGLFYIEGLRFVAEAVRHHAKIETLVFCPHLLTHPFARKLAQEQGRAGTPMLEVTPEVMHSIALVDDPQGLGAVVRQKWLPLERVKLGGKLCWLALESVQSPGNLGSILRTSEAAGGAGVILLGDSIDPYDPATVRATMGAMFAQRFVRTSIDEFARWKGQRQWTLVGTSPHAEMDYHSVIYPSPAVLLMGSERKGLSDELQALCDVMVRIPIVGRSDSLNIAVAAGVVLYELFNQRRSERAKADRQACL